MCGTSKFSVPQDCWHLSLRDGRYVLDLIRKLNLWHFHHFLHSGMVGTHQRTCQCTAPLEPRQSSAELRRCASATSQARPQFEFSKFPITGPTIFNFIIGIPVNLVPNLPANKYLGIILVIILASMVRGKQLKRLKHRDASQPQKGRCAPLRFMQRRPRRRS